MKRVTEVEIIFGLIALALIYFVISSNATITGFITSPSHQISLVYPEDNAHTTQTTVEFMFKYPYELDISECSLLLNGQVAETTMSMLSAMDSRIRVELLEGSYIWSIECFDETSKTKVLSKSRRLVIGEGEEPELRISKFPDRDGYIYEFDLREGLELELNELVPNDMIRVNQGENSYEMHLVRMIQDYALGTEMVEFMILPGNKRVKLNEGESSDIDFNNDGEADLNLMLEDLAYGKASFIATTPADEGIEPPTISIKPLADERGQAEEQQPAQTSPASDGRPSLNLLELFLLGIIVILIIAIISTIRTREHSEKAYLSDLKHRIAQLKKPKPKTRKAKPGKKTSKKKTRRKRRKKK